MSADLPTLGELDDLVAELRNIQRRAALEYALRVGELVVARVFGGSVDAWRTRARDHGARFEALAARRDLPMHPTALSRAVSTYVLWVRAGAEKRWEHITTSHVQEVLGLPEAQQVPLLDAADAAAWSTRQLRIEVSHLAAPAPSRRGRPRSARSVLAARHLDELVASGDLVRELEAIAALPVSQRQNIERTLEDLEAQVRAIRHATRAGSGGELTQRDRALLRLAEIALSPRR